MIVGAGHNGLAAGIILAQAGWKVLIVESQPEPGGAIRTAQVTLPGYEHDLFATNLNAFAGSAFVREFGKELARHGLQFVRAAKAFCSVFPDGDALGVTTSVDETLADFRRLSPHDAEAWRSLIARFERVRAPLLGLLQQPMPSWAAVRAVLSAPLALTRSAGAFVGRHFDHSKVRALCAVWGMHLDFPPEARGGGLYPFLQCMLMQANGLSIGQGGARTMIDALAGLFREKGGELLCSTRVDEVITEGGRAAGVVARGERLTARRAVIGNVTPTVLFKLLKHAPSGVLRKVERYRYGPGTMMVHVALSDLPDWRAARARDFAYVHVAPTLDGMSRAYREAVSGVLPQEPVLVVAQPTVVDPSRAPQGGHVLSIQVRVVPSALDWDAIKEAYADRVLHLLESYAPGLRRQIRARCILSPADLERANPNLVGGDNIAGSHQLGQQFIFRPFLGWSRYRTPVKHLYLCGAATWPGAGVGAGSGYLLGKQLAREKTTH